MTDTSVRELDHEGALCRLGSIAALLRSTKPLWHESAFFQVALSWESGWPGLVRALRSLSLAESEQLHGDFRQARRFFGRWFPIEEWSRQAAIGRWPTTGILSWPRGFERDIPGRKWSQLTAFSAALRDAGLPGVEWCAGKAHLSRCLSQHWNRRPVVALERQHALVEQARKLAARARLPLYPRQCDVMSEAVFAALGSSVQVVALHACGDLHLRLFECAIASRVPLLACAPCCYHLCAASSPIVLSRAARDAGLALERTDLRTAVQETVTAPGHARRRRQRVQEWQLGFDVLQRDARGVDEYLPLPPIPARLLDAGFESYCRDVAARKRIELPAAVAFADYEAAGRERFRTVTALDLVRHLFRRLLELWLVCDRACHLAEHGYRIGVAEFCGREVTPRNLLLQAWA